jgi:uncharacterized delta-60 repeat protein
MKTILFFFLSCCFCITGNAQLYGLDPTFANNGLYLGDTGGVEKIAIQPDDKVVVVFGEMRNGVFPIAMRFNSNGTVDNSFANSGHFKLPSSLSNNYHLNIFTVELQNDGRIIIAGEIDTVYRDASNPNAGDINFFILRLKSNGDLDSTFGGGGYVINSLLPYNPLGNFTEGIADIAIQADGKIIAYGYWDGFERSLRITRFHTDGTLDSSFGINGSVRSEISSWGLDYPTPNQIDIMQDGRIVIGSKANIFALNPPFGNRAFTAIRLHTNGSLDTSFNHTGIAYTNTNLPGLVYCKAMRLQPDGKILLGGYADSLAVVRFDTSGTLDNSFGKNGLTKLKPTGKLIEMVVQPDNRILLGTNPEAFPYFDTSFTTYRLMSNGDLDYSFGINGGVTTQPPGASAGDLGDIALQSDGRIVFAGSYILPNTSLYKFLLGRYTPNATLVADPNASNAIFIYPNPSSNFFTIDNKSAYPIQNAALYSMDGKLLYSCTEPNTNRINTDGLAIGMYLLKIRFANHATTTRKLIIQKN